MEIWISGVSRGYKMGTLTRNELNQEFERAQQNFIELYKILN